VGAVAVWCGLVQFREYRLLPDTMSPRLRVMQPD